MTSPEKEPLQTPVLSSSSSSRLLPQTTWVFRGLSWELERCCLMLRINTPPSWVTTTHTGKTSACGTDSPLLPTVPGGAQDSKLLHRVQHRSFPPFPSDQAPLLVRPPRTQQQWAPQLDPTIPCRSQTSPDPSPCGAEPLSLSPDLSPQERGDSESRC